MTDMLLRGQFWVENELIQGSWQNQRRGMLWEPRVIKSVREGNGGRFQGRRKGNEKSLFCRRSVWADFRSSMIIMSRSRCMHWVLHWEERISGAVCHLLYRVSSYDIGERCSSVQDEENGPQYWTLRHTVHELWWWRRRSFDWSGLISERYDWNHWSAVDWMPKRELILDQVITECVWLWCVYVCAALYVSLQYVCVCVWGGSLSGVCRARAHVQSVAASLVRTCGGGGGGAVFYFWQSVLHVSRLTQRLKNKH